MPSQKRRPPTATVWIHDELKPDYEFLRSHVADLGMESSGGNVLRFAVRLAAKTLRAPKHEGDRS